MSAQPAGGWPLRRRLHFVYALLATVLVLVSVAGGFAYARTAAAVNDQNSRISPARADGLRLVVALLDQETGLRGYALSGNASFLGPYDQGVAAAKQYDTAMRALLAGHPQAIADLDTLDAAVARWRVEFAQPVLDLVSRHGTVTNPALLDKGRSDFDQIRAAADVLDRRLAGMLAAAHDRIERLLRLLSALFALTIVCVVLIGVGIWRALRRWVTGPLDALSGEVRQVVTGHLDHGVVASGPPEVLALAGDVESMRRRIVAELRTAEARRDTIEAQAAQLTAQAADLSRSNAELEQFAYVASHDLQEPLRKIASFCQLLQRRYGGQLDERADQYIGFAVDGAKRMQRLINDLLAFSRVGRFGAADALVSCDAAFAHALENLATVIEETGADVSADPLPTVRGDAALLTQVFQNLIGNSVKFRGEAPPTVRVSAWREGDDWQFRCQDNGIGIEPEYADRIFVIFQRLHGQDVYEGTGIGLSMCKKIIEYHGGRIWLDSSHRDGASFRWTLPAADRRERDEQAPGDARRNQAATAAHSDGSAA